MTPRIKKSGTGTRRQPVWRRQRKLASWAVIAALIINILSAAVLPGLSNAAVPQTGDEDVLVICTQNGFKLIYLDGRDEPEPVENTAGNGSCVFCLAFNKPILSVSAAAIVISECNDKHVRLSTIRDADQGVASIALKPLGSRAPPTCS